MATLDEYRQQYKDDHNGEEPPSLGRGTTERSLGALPVTPTQEAKPASALNGWLIAAIIGSVIVVAVIASLATALFLKTRKAVK